MAKQYRRESQSNTVTTTRRRRRPGRRQRRRKRFRWELVLIPLAIFLFAWIYRGIEPAGTWDDMIDFLRVRSRERYTMLGCLGIVIVATCSILKALRRNKQ